jgi:hypothetical protein
MLSPNGFESGVGALVVSFRVEIPSPALWVLVDIHGGLPGEVRGIACDRAIGLIRLDTFERPSDFEIADLAVVWV